MPKQLSKGIKNVTEKTVGPKELYLTAGFPPITVFKNSSDKQLTAYLGIVCQKLSILLVNIFPSVELTQSLWKNIPMQKRQKVLSIRCIPQHTKYQQRKPTATLTSESTIGDFLPYQQNKTGASEE